MYASITKFKCILNKSRLISRFLVSFLNYHICLKHFSRFHSIQTFQGGEGAGFMASQLTSLEKKLYGCQGVQILFVFNKRKKEVYNARSINVNIKQHLDSIIEQTLRAFINECSDTSMEVDLPANFKKSPTDQPTNQQTDIRDHRKLHFQSKYTTMISCKGSISIIQSKYMYA